MLTTFSFSGDPNLGPSLVPLPTAWTTATPLPGPSTPPKPTSTITLAQAAEAVVAAKAKAGYRPYYVTTLRQMLRQLIRGDESKLLATVDVDWLEGRIHEVGGRKPASRLTYIHRISALFSHAVRRGWMQDNPCSRLERPRLIHQPPAIITTDQVRQMLDTAPVDLRAYLVLCTFLGLRPSEAERTDWRNVRLQARKCIIDAAACKTGRRRIVPIGDAAAAWLALDARESGPIVSSHSTMRRRRRLLGQAMGWTLTQDVLRHTYASMSIAAGVGVQELADRMGNSRAVIGRHYAELVDAEEAARFWALRPT